MRQYLYISTGRDLAPGEVEKIVETSERRNAERGITGFLVYNGASFLQVIEGEVEALDTLMKDLAGDPRHHGIVKLEDVPIKTRAFPQWRMRNFSFEDSGRVRRFDLATELTASLDANIRRLALNFAEMN